MIKEEAIEILSDIRAEYNIFSDDEEEATRYHALSLAIQALNEQQPDTPTDTPTDTISRQAAIDILMKEWNAYKDYPYVSHVRHGLEIAIAILENKVPSAQRTGRWIPVAGRMGKEVQCDCCGEVFWYWLANFTYCPNCGAQMEVEEDE